MPFTPNDLTIRPITGPEELDLFRELPYVLDHELADDLAERRRRPEWMWIARRGDRVLARVAWWSRPGDLVPDRLDILDVLDGGDDARRGGAPGPDRLDVGELLLRTAMSAVLPAGSTPPEYGRFVAPDWRDTPASARTVQDRMAILRRTGAELFVERLRLEWRPGASPLPAPAGHLAFRPVDGTGELIDLMTSALTGTLDAHGRDDLTRMSARQAAVRHYEDELARFTSPRDWWCVATLPDKEPVGFVIPAHNGYNPVIAYIAVLPAHRGKGHIDALLAHGTRLLAEQDVPRVRAATDLGNVPMARAFRRAGYVEFGREITMTWS
ncbi:GNAT family N-acetyltransferase [Streptomyces sp. NPDC048664]|uniref:GNAT family N-acetyltransferase n=1 Tax=Streptomyces sp. NPDC048664 TaxID=3154505 RepID=UPI0034219EC1